MLFIIVGGLLGLVVGALLIKHDDVYDRVMTGLLLLLMGAAVGFLLAVGCSAILPSHSVANQPEYLHNLHDQNNTEGRFFLGSGVVDNVTKLFYTYQNQDGSFSFDDITKKSVDVFEDNPEKPYLLVYHVEFNQSWMSLLGFPKFSSNPNKPEFHIPAGSIDNNYTIQ